jgi:hypothetical protein
VLVPEDKQVEEVVWEADKGRTGKRGQGDVLHYDAEKGGVTRKDTDQVLLGVDIFEHE